MSGVCVCVGGGGGMYASLCRPIILCVRCIGYVGLCV